MSPDRPANGASLSSPHTTNGMSSSSNTSNSNGGADASDKMRNSATAAASSSSSSVSTIPSSPPQPDVQGAKAGSAFLPPPGRRGGDPQLEADSALYQGPSAHGHGNGNGNGREGPCYDALGFSSPSADGAAAGAGVIGTGVGGGGGGVRRNHTISSASGTRLAKVEQKLRDANWHRLKSHFEDPAAPPPVPPKAAYSSASIAGAGAASGESGAGAAPSMASSSTSSSSGTAGAMTRSSTAMQSSLSQGGRVDAWGSSNGNGNGNSNGNGSGGQANEIAGDWRAPGSPIGPTPPSSSYYSGSGSGAWAGAGSKADPWHDDGLQALYDRVTVQRNRSMPSSRGKSIFPSSSSTAERQQAPPLPTLFNSNSNNNNTDSAADEISQSSLLLQTASSPTSRFFPRGAGAGASALGGNGAATAAGAGGADDDDDEADGWRQTRRRSASGINSDFLSAGALGSAAGLGSAYNSSAFGSSRAAGMGWGSPSLGASGSRLKSDRSAASPWDSPVSEILESATRSPRAAGKGAAGSTASSPALGPQADLVLIGGLDSGPFGTRSGSPGLASPSLGGSGGAGVRRHQSLSYRTSGTFGHGSSARNVTGAASTSTFPSLAAQMNSGGLTTAAASPGGAGRGAPARSSTLDVAPPNGLEIYEQGRSLFSGEHVQGNANSSPAVVDVDEVADSLSAMNALDGSAASSASPFAASQRSGAAAQSRKLPSLITDQESLASRAGLPTDRPIAGPVSASAYVPPIGHGHSRNDSAGTSPLVYIPRSERERERATQRTPPNLDASQQQWQSSSPSLGSTPASGQRASRVFLPGSRPPSNNVPFTSVGGPGERPFQWPPSHQRSDSLGTASSGNDHTPLATPGGMELAGAREGNGTPQLNQQQQRFGHPEFYASQRQQPGLPSQANEQPALLGNMDGAHAAAHLAATSGIQIPQELAVEVDQLIKQRHFNPPDFPYLQPPPGTRYFVIKSFTEDDVQKSLKHEIWASTEKGNARLDKAFRETKGLKAGSGAGAGAGEELGPGNGPPIYLFYSVNASGHFCGMAEMTSALD